MVVSHILIHKQKHDNSTAYYSCIHKHHLNTTNINDLSETSRSGLRYTCDANINLFEGVTCCRGLIDDKLRDISDSYISGTRLSISKTNNKLKRKNRYNVIATMVMIYLLPRKRQKSRCVKVKI